MRSFASARGREIKAAKIKAVLCASMQRNELSDFDILDLGSGSGHIAATLAETNRVTAADIQDQLQITSPNLRFIQITDSNLPFVDGSYDIVVLNFVLMYVSDPLGTLKDVKRILKPGGLCYVALPNRMFPIDPHTRLPFVSYLPTGIYGWIVNKVRGTNERIRLLTPGSAIRIFKSAGFEVEDFTPRILHAPALFYVSLPISLPSWHWLSWLAPSNIYVLHARSTS